MSTQPFTRYEFGRMAAANPRLRELSELVDEVRRRWRVHLCAHAVWRGEIAGRLAAVGLSPYEHGVATQVLYDRLPNCRHDGQCAPARLVRIEIPAMHTTGERR